MSLLPRPLNDDNHTHAAFDDSDDEEGRFNAYYEDDLEEEEEEGYDVAGQKLCVICQDRPAYSKNGKRYPTCGLTCAKALEDTQANNLPRVMSPAKRSRQSNPSLSVPRLPARVAAPSRQDGLEEEDGQKLCVVCQDQPAYSKNGKSYPTCGLSCAKVLQLANAKNISQVSSTPRGSLVNGKPSKVGNTSTRGHATSATTTMPTTPNNSRRQVTVTFQLCVVCVSKPCHDTKFVTCGLTCAEKLVTSGPHDKTMCDYCHRRPKVTGKNQCGATCAQKAKLACLLCKTRPHLGRYPLCGKSCQQMAMKSGPLLLEALEDHIIFEKVVNKFQSAWKIGPAATIKRVYKIIENKTFLQPYDVYKKSHGNKEVFRYHGTSRKCTLGAAGNTTLCSISGCALCSILRTSFKISLAKPSGAFGAGVYSSSASNKAYSYTAAGAGALILTKVILGKVYDVGAFAQVSSCPSGYNSVVFDRQNGSLNETIVYTDDAIRPVYLIIF